MPPEIPLIRTKIIIPRRRSEMLSRPRLLSILDNILELKLLIIAAPAGYGKTSLLVDYSHHTQLPVCWFALDSLDSDLKRFIAHFIASINSKFPDFGELSLAALADLSQDNENLDPVISAIVNDSFEHISEHFLFVLDDYHLVRDCKQIEGFMNRIIQEAAENFHFIIASRTLLTLPDLSLLVARSQVDGLSFEELAFLPEEIKQLMAVNYRQTISDIRAEEMIDLTEGWITGLLLTVLLAPHGTGDRSRVEKVSGVGIYEYLTQQVFDRQTIDMQSFLLRTSLLEEFDAVLCEKIIGKSLGLSGQNWEEVIERIQRDNLFVLPVGDETLFLRYHHLFRDFLQNRMRVEHPEETEKIEFALAEHYQSTQEWERAISIHLRSGNHDRVEALIRKAAPSMILSGRQVTLSEWLESLPGNAADSKPELLSIRGSIALLRGDTKTSLTLLNKAIQGLRQSAYKEELAEALIRRSAVNRQLGHYEFSLQDALEAMDLCNSPSGFPALFAEGLRSEGLVYYHTGELNDAQWKLRESYRRYMDLGLELDAAKVLMELGIVYRTQGDLEQTERCYAESLSFWQATRNPTWQANVLNNIGVLQHLRGHFEQAVITLEKALTYARLSVNPRLEGYILTSLGDLYKDLRASAEAKQAYGQAIETLNKTKDFSLDVYVTLAQSELERLDGNFESAEKILIEAFQKAEDSGSKYAYYICLLEQYSLHLKQGKQSMLQWEFQALEEYFTAAGYQMESLKSAFLKNLAELLETKPTNLESLESFVASNEQGIKHQSLMRVSLEHEHTLSGLIKGEDGFQEIHKLLKEIEKFRKDLPQIHKIIRRFSSAVQFANPKLSIRSLGKMQVRLGNRVITGKDWKTQLVRDLFYYLLAHPEGATKEEIGEAFWPDADRDTVRLRFKNTIYRMRCAIGKDLVTYSEDYYRFNRSLDFEFDLDVFLQELELAEKVAEDDEKIDHLSAAISAYRGPYLPKLDMDWVLNARARYHQKFIQAASNLISHYMKTNRFTQAVSLSDRVLEEDMYNESVYRSSMQAYSALNNRPAVVQQFERCKKILMNELEIEPSPQTINLFNSLMHH